MADFCHGAMMVAKGMTSSMDAIGTRREVINTTGGALYLVSWSQNEGRKNGFQPYDCTLVQIKSPKKKTKMAKKEKYQAIGKGPTVELEEYESLKNGSEFLKAPMESLIFCLDLQRILHLLKVCCINLNSESVASGRIRPLGAEWWPDLEAGCAVGQRLTVMSDGEVLRT